MSFTRAVLFANGQVPDLTAAGRLLTGHDLLIAVDGGARHLTALGRLPGLLIGDLDSLLPEEIEALRAEGVPIQQHPPEKDETDLELAIQYAARQGVTTLVVAGGLGGRLDHTLANLFLLNQPELTDRQARLDDGREAVFLIRKQATIRGEPGDTLSLLPLGAPADGVNTRGLRYPLRNETLFPERSRGISNELFDPQAEVSLRSGLLICIHTRNKELAPNESDPYIFS